MERIYGYTETDKRTCPKCGHGAQERGLYDVESDCLRFKCWSCQAEYITVCFDKNLDATRRTSTVLNAVNYSFSPEMEAVVCVGLIVIVVLLAYAGYRVSQHP